MYIFDQIYFSISGKDNYLGMEEVDNNTVFENIQVGVHDY